MPNYAISDETGDLGIDLVSLQVRRFFSWIFREQQKNDLGIDGHIEIVDENREGTGRLIALQVKAGDSYFKNETDSGYFFYGKNKHLKYWLQHSLPVIIVLCDPKKDICYWVPVTESGIEYTDSGWKILVPKKQILNEASKNKLISIAGMPQHSDIVELALFKYLSDKYHKYSEYGRLDIVPLMYEPRDFMYFTCMAEFEKTSEIVYIAHHYDIYELFSIEHLKEFLRWREMNMYSCGHLDPVPKLYIYAITENKSKLVFSDEVIELLSNSKHVELIRLFYSYHDKFPSHNGKYYDLLEF